MTCIVGITDPKTKKIYIGADSTASDGWRKSDLITPKVFILQNKFLIGFTTSFRMGQVLQYDFTPPPHKRGSSVDKYMVSVFIKALRKCYLDSGFASKNNEKERGGECLIGYKGHLFRIQDDYSVLETLHYYDAVGSGYLVALGSLYTSITNSKKSNKQKILIALEAATKHIATVGEPYTILEIGK